jgi:hypothetical protein
MTRGPRRDMTEAERAEARRRSKFYKNMRALGRPAIATDEEFEQLKTHIRMLAASGMSYQEIGRQAGMSATTPRECLERHNAVRWSTARRILAVPPQPNPFGRMPPFHTQRRLQAMGADGYSQLFMARHLGTPKNTIWKWTNKTPAFIETKNHLAVCDLYDKYVGTNPLDHGMALQPMRNAQSNAKKHGWAPSHCWDSDTIDDPDAIPEWTGRCGSMAGYNIHYKYKILPACQPCRDAKNGKPRE